MAASVAPILLVIDVSTLSSTSTREWLSFSRVGACYIPQIVYEEMRFLYDRSPDPDLERVARDFNRFYSTSGWQITDAIGHHMILKSATGYALTKRLRVSLSVARCAYALSQKNPRSLVVMVASDRSILQRVYDIQAPNLTGIQSTALLQWSRSGQRPVAITQKLQEMKADGLLESMSTNLTSVHRQSSVRSVPSASNRVAVTSVPRNSAARSYSLNHSSSARKSSNTGRKVTGYHSRPKKVFVDLPPWFPQFFSMFLSLIALACAGGVIWIIFFTNMLDRFVPAEEALGQRSAHIQVKRQ